MPTSGRSTDYNRSVDMSRAVLERDVPRGPRSFAANHPGYGAGAIAAANENLAAELAARRPPPPAAASTPRPARAQQPATTTAITTIDAQLAAARKATAAAKAAYEKALAAEEKLTRERERLLAQETKTKRLQREKEEKLRRRERALGLKPSQALDAARPTGIQKKRVVRSNIVGERRREAVEGRVQRVSKRDGLSVGFLEE